MRLGTQIISMTVVDVDSNTVAYGPIGISFCDNNPRYSLNLSLPFSPFSPLPLKSWRFPPLSSLLLSEDLVHMLSDLLHTLSDLSYTFLCRVDKTLAHSVLKALNNKVKQDENRIAIVTKMMDQISVAAQSSPMATGELSFANVSTGCSTPFHKITTSLDSFLSSKKTPLRLSTGRYETRHIAPALKCKQPYLLAPALPNLPPYPLSYSDALRRPAPDGVWMIFMGSFSDLIVLLSVASQEIPLQEGDTVHGKIRLGSRTRLDLCNHFTHVKKPYQTVVVIILPHKLASKHSTLLLHLCVLIGHIRLHIPDFNPLWADGIVPIVNSGMTPDLAPRHSVYFGYSTIQELANSAIAKSRSILPSVLLWLETASTAKIISILIDNNGGIKTPQPARTINNFIRETMNGGKPAYETARSLHNISLSQLLLSFDTFSSSTLKATAVLDSSSTDLDGLDEDLEKVAAAPVMADDFHWGSIIPDSDNEEVIIMPNHKDKRVTLQGHQTASHLPRITSTLFGPICLPPRNPLHNRPREPQLDPPLLGNATGSSQATIRYGASAIHPCVQKQNLMHKLGVPNSQEKLYFEKQMPGSNHCQVHAINNAYGSCISTPATLLNFIAIQFRENPSHEGWMHAYERNTGVSDDAIQEWLRSNNLLITQVHPCLTHSRHICSTLDSLAKLHNYETFLCRNSNHAFAVKKFKGIWKLLDSLYDTPIDMRTSNINSCFAAFKLTLIEGHPRERTLPSTYLYMEKQEKSF